MTNVYSDHDPQVSPEKSEPYLIRLTDGSYVQWDKHQGFYRIAYYERRAQKGSDFEMTLALAMKKPLHNSKVKRIFAFVSATEEYEDASSS
jgi:hypothetical protein